MAEPRARVAAESAARAAARSGLDVRVLDGLSEVRACERLLRDVWGGSAPMPADLIQGMVDAGSYVAGAFDGDVLLGAAAGFWGPPDEPVMHSHIAGVSAAGRGRDVGYALKLHQRAHALAHGVDTIVWTYDPLVARNAHFNLRKLGARPAAYRENHYGDLPDDLNLGGHSDRFLLRWDLAEPAAVAACDAREPLVATAASALLAIGPTGAPARRTGTVAGAALVAVPGDIESLRRSDPALAAQWRAATREVLAGLFDAGGRVVDFDRAAGGYVVEEGPR